MCTGVVHMSLQADGNIFVAFEEIPVFGICCPACHDASSYLFVLVLCLEAVVCTQVYVTLHIFYHHVDWVVVCTHRLRLCDVHKKNQTHLPTFIG